MHLKKVYILLVEDNDGDVMITREAMESATIGIELSVVNDGKEAIDFIHQQGKYEGCALPDLILLDVNLPKKNGHEVLKFIKETALFKHIPVIMLTTSSSATDINFCYNNYANCFITKPVDVNDYVHVVTAIENFWLSVVQLPQISKN